MLFTTAAFFCLYLPLTRVLFFALGRWRPQWAVPWLFLASTTFYGVWMPMYVTLLLGSIVANYVLGRQISAQRAAGRTTASKRWMQFGVIANLALLAYYKYANFFIDNLNSALGTHWGAADVLLPVGISFFTFTQIAFLADSHLKGVQEPRFSHYGLFVTYFPHLIAGPVLHHAQMMPQFKDPATLRPQSAMIATGLAVFVIGLTKKVVLADGISPYADAVFNPVDAGSWPTLQEAWLGALAYTLQIYFDFSGYSDMAIGLSLMFNIRLPFNFDAPYQARNISDFWRRWHISLSTFLRDYLYITLGGNRRGAVRRYFNLAATMVIGGLWHGASWSFVLWGALHGTYLMINHAWRALCQRLWPEGAPGGRAWRTVGWALTLLGVIVAWVFFRATTLEGAGRLIYSLGGGDLSAVDPLLWAAGLPAERGWWLCAALGAVALWAPNSNRIGQQLERWMQHRPAHRVTVGAAALLSAAALVLLNTARDSVSAFIYFNF